jgi:hypothetical protein
MATLRENLEMEIQRRQQLNDSLRLAEQDTQAAIAQFEELEALYKAEIDKARQKLEAAYLEKKHYDAKWPIVYDEARVDAYPYFGGTTDNLCNPYFPISLVQAGTEKGIAPVESAPDRTTGGPNVRDRDHSPIESDPRTVAGAALTVYPDTSNETPYGAPYLSPVTYPANATADTCYYGVGGEPDEPTCSLNGGTWVLLGQPIPDPPPWIDTAPELLEVDLLPWKTDVQTILADVDTSNAQTYSNPVLGSNRTAQQWWQDVLDEINTCLGLLPTSVFVGDPLLNWGITPAPAGALLTSLNNLIAYANTHITAFITQRTGDLQSMLDTQEDVFFGIVKLRLHQVNGSLSKLNSLQDSKTNNDEIIADNEQAIIDIQKLISAL